MDDFTKQLKTEAEQTTAQQTQDMSVSSRLLHLESLTRRVNNLDELQFLIANNTSMVLPVQQVALLACKHINQCKFKLRTVSNVSVLQGKNRFSNWLEAIAQAEIKPEDLLQFQKQLNNSQEEAKEENYLEPRILWPTEIADKLSQEWQDHTLATAVLAPLIDVKGNLIGALWLARDTLWTEPEIALIKQLCEIYTYTLQVQTFCKRRYLPGALRKTIYFGLSGLAFLAMFLPVKLTTVAEVEVVAKKPRIVSAPINGVLNEIYQPPNQVIQKGDLLFSLEDTTLRNELLIADKTLALIKVKLEKYRNASFSNPAEASEIALLESEVVLTEAKRDYAKEKLGKVKVHAETSGLLIYTSESDWLGKPVAVGEGIMEVADPEQFQFRINLPVDDAIVLKKDFPVNVYLDVDPTEVYQANISRASFRAKQTPDNLMAFQVDAEPIAGTSPLRIGLRGTARIFGQHAPLYFLLFRRPYAAFRQYFGL